MVFFHSSHEIKEKEFLNGSKWFTLRPISLKYLNDVILSIDKGIFEVVNNAGEKLFDPQLKKYVTFDQMTDLKYFLNRLEFLRVDNWINEKTEPESKLTLNIALFQSVQFFEVIYKVNNDQRW
jgi:hypothetical protein